MSRGSRARDRQRHRERAKRDLVDVPTEGLVDELIRRLGIGTGYIQIDIRNGHFLQFWLGDRLSAEALGGPGAETDDVGDNRLDSPFGDVQSRLRRIP